MSSNEKPGRGRRGQRTSKSTLSRSENEVILQVEELLVNTQLARGAYNAEKFYGHVVVKPKEEMIIRVPVSELGTVVTIREVIEKLEKEVTDGIDAQIRMREGRGTGVTPVTEIKGLSGRAMIESVVGPEEEDQF